MSLPVEAERLDLFTKVVHTVFKRWTALQLAIANANFPSGHRTQELAEHTLEFFSQHKTEVYPDEIAENLKDFFDEIFDVELEDGSPEQIGKSLVRMYREVVIDGNLEEARKLVQSAVATSSLAHSKVEKDDDSDSDDEDEAAPGAQSADQMDVDSSQAAVPRPRPEPVVDEDGFELVQRKGRRKH